MTNRDRWELFMQTVVVPLGLVLMTWWWIRHGSEMPSNIEQYLANFPK